MAKDFANKMNNKETSDVTIRVEKTSIYCHKVILSRCEKLFQKTGGHPNKIKITHFKKTEVLDFCDYLYTGKLPQEDERLKNLLTVAHTYSFPFLRQLCEYELINRKPMPRISTLPIHLGSILESGLYYDCTFLVDHKKFKLHKFVLSNRCEFFKMLLIHVQQKDQPVEIKEISRLDFKCVVQFIYTDFVHNTHLLSLDELFSLWKAAKMFTLINLVIKTEYYLVEHISTNTVEELLMMSENGMVRLRKACICFIASNLKNLAKHGVIEDLDENQMAEVKKLAKEVKKEKKQKKGKTDDKYAIFFTKRPKTPQKTVPTKSSRMPRRANTFT